MATSDTIACLSTKVSVLQAKSRPHSSQKTDNWFFTGNRRSKPSPARSSRRTPRSSTQRAFLSQLASQERSANAGTSTGATRRPGPIAVTPIVKASTRSSGTELAMETKSRSRKRGKVSASELNHHFSTAAGRMKGG